MKFEKATMKQALKCLIPFVGIRYAKKDKFVTGRLLNWLYFIHNLYVLAVTLIGIAIFKILQ